MQPAHSVTKNEKSPATARSMRNCVSGWSTPSACAALTIAKWVSGVNGERKPAFVADLLHRVRLRRDDARDHVAVVVGGDDSRIGDGGEEVEQGPGAGDDPERAPGGRGVFH